MLGNINIFGSDPGFCFVKLTFSFVAPRGAPKRRKSGPQEAPKSPSRPTGDPNEAQKVVPTDIQEPKVDPKVIPRGSKRALSLDFAKTCAKRSQDEEPSGLQDLSYKAPDVTTICVPTHVFPKMTAGQGRVGCFVCFASYDFSAPYFCFWEVSNPAVFASWQVCSWAGWQ